MSRYQKICSIENGGNARFFWQSLERMPNPPKECVTEAQYKLWVEKYIDDSLTYLSLMRKAGRLNALRRAIRAGRVFYDAGWLRD